MSRDWKVAALACFAACTNAFPLIWFLRFSYYYFAADFFPDKHAIDNVITYGITFPSDLDANLKMRNDSKYLQKLDFATANFYLRTGLIHYFGINSIFQHNMAIRYRKPLYLFQPFIVETRLMWFEKISFYFEHRFITVHDGYIRAVCWSKNTIVDTTVGKTDSGVDLVKGFYKIYGIKQPKCPKELCKIIQAHNISSRTLRNA